MKRIFRLVIFSFLLSQENALAADRAQASSNEGAFVVFASGNLEADFAKLEAERILLRFNQLFGLTNSRRASPIVLVLGSPENNQVPDQGAVRIYRKGSWIKIQVNWRETPMGLEVFQKAWVRALCVRSAVDRMNESQRQYADLRIPLWVAEGVAVLVADDSFTQKGLSRATLLARTEPNLSLEGALAELEGRSELNCNACAISAVICRALTRDRSSCNRFLSTLNWDAKTTAREWIARVGEVKDLNQWWRDVWVWNAAQLSWMKLGFWPTMRCLGPQSPMEDSTGKNPPVSETKVATVAHPWFREFLGGRSARSGNQEGPISTSEQCKNIELRRAAALSWYCEFLQQQPLPSRPELLEWYILQNNLKLPKPAGPVARWFNTMGDSKAPPKKNRPIKADAVR